MVDDARHFIGECVLKVRWSDLDNYGHVNNSAYFEYMTEGRAEMLSHIISPYDQVQYVLVAVACQFKKPVFYPESLLLKHYLTHMGSTSFTLITDICSATNDVFYAQGEATLVCLDKNTQKPVRIPDFLHERLSQ